MLDPALQEALRHRPNGRPVMRQSWRELLFLHLACDPASIAPLLPPGLSVDTFPDADGIEKAWIGLVPFRMQGVRWSFSPPIPGTHTFPETNVRTYVHYEGKNPGVWFFSLDATSRLAVRIARMAFALPYFHAAMSIQRDDDHLTYKGLRGHEEYRIEAQIGSDRTPSALDFFLLERYLLYSARGDRLWSGRVHHVPYRLREADPKRVEETLLRAAGLQSLPFTHTVYSDGVDVEVFPLRSLR